MSRIAIVAALAGELKPLVRGWRRERRGSVVLWRRTGAKAEWIAVCAGSGSAAAERAFAEVAKEGPIDLIVSIGWAGALSDACAPGMAYRVAGVVDADTGERFPAADAVSAASSARPASGFPPSTGTVGSLGCWLATSRCVADSAEKRRLAAAHAADLVDMESAVVARLAKARGLPFACVKGVSDALADRLPDFNRFISAEGKFRLLPFVLFAGVRPWRWRALFRLGRNSAKAAGALARSVRALFGDD
ncbi:MAG: hypothetical protein ACREFX_14625 [Opitutaceae bacterium]